MCGILGVANADGAPPPEALDALDLLAHRGPDGRGTFTDGCVAFGMTRLAIIDLETGDQPLANERGDVVCVLNGEIYNHVELRRDLERSGHVLASHSDVAVVPHLYEEHGLAFVEKLRGMFALALWDAREHRLVLARDRFGIKPLYLVERGRELQFSSEIRPLLSLGSGATVDMQAVADLLALGYVPGTATGVEEVRALAPGTVLTWHDGSVARTTFGSLVPSRADPETTIAESVQLHLRSDVPLAVLLSGGLDSSLIASLAARESGEPLHTFTVGFGESGFDEVVPARVVADAIGSVHHEVRVTPHIADDLPAIVRSLEEPLGDPSAIPLWYVCRAVAADVKVALAGEGGDELFGGYARYAWDRHAARLAQALPTAKIAAAAGALLEPTARRGGRRNVVRRGLKLLRHAALPQAERYFSWFALLDDDAVADVVGGPTLSASRVFGELFASAPAGLSDLGRLQYVDLGTMLQSDLLLKADRMSMAHSLELRVPLLDQKVAEMALALPDRAKVRGVETKRVLRELVRGRLPAQIARRPKQGFEVPVGRWLRHELKPLAVDMLSPSTLARHGVVAPDAAQRLLQRHLEGEELGLPVYSLIVLGLWLDGLKDRTHSLAA